MMLPGVPVPDEERQLDNRKLKKGYTLDFLERWPLNTDIKSCSSVESAYFLHLEMENMQVPEELEFDNLRGSMPEQHHGRLQHIWDQLCIQQREFIQSQWAIKLHTERVPEHDDLVSDEIINNGPQLVQDKFRSAIHATITPTLFDPNGLTPLQDWQKHFRALRGEFYYEHKKYLVLLRLYYEMLIETSEDNSEYVLPEDHPERHNVVVRNRYLRIIDAAYQAFAAAKSAHHQQEKGRLRRSEDIPYVSHTLDVTFALILDVIPFVIEDDEAFKKIGPIILPTVAPIHDALEDTTLDIQTLIDNFLKRLLDQYDSSIDPVIIGGFGASKDKIKRKNLDLVDGGKTKIVKQIMRILSNNTQMTDREKMTALEQNIAGADVTMEKLGITKRIAEKGWCVQLDNLPEPGRTFNQFPEEHDDGKITRFLMRLHAITPTKKTQHQALLVKAEDRANNIATLDGLPVENQLKQIRAATSRLIAWIMLDHDNNALPLYNALLRLIYVTIQAYDRLREEYPEYLEDVDEGYYNQLCEWYAECFDYKLPEDVQKVSDVYHAVV